ncbi:MAG: UDP-3-O-acyl-N-acetylglucosamine deacetylase [bacterium]
MIKQKTIKKEVSFYGIGVHSGNPVSVKVKPAYIDSGIIIKNKNFPNDDIKLGTIIPEIAMHATVIKNSKYFISTIEHLISAIIWLEIDNVIIETQDPEIPILDGSALPFVQGLIDAQVIEQESDVKFLTPIQNLQFKDENDRLIEIIPAKKDGLGNFDNSLYIEYQMNFNHYLVGDSKIEAKITPEFFEKNIAPARTFGFLNQLPELKKYGLAKGTSLGNTVVVGDDLLNDQRFDNEFAKHKLLDFLGDIGLLGKRLAGKVKAVKTGHSFNRLVVEHYIKNPDKWREIN